MIESNRGKPVITYLPYKNITESRRSIRRTKLFLWSIVIILLTCTVCGVVILVDKMMGVVK